MVVEKEIEATLVLLGTKEREELLVSLEALAYMGL